MYHNIISHFCAFEVFGSDDVVLVQSDSGQYISVEGDNCPFKEPVCNL